MAHLAKILQQLVMKCFGLAHRLLVLRDIHFDGCIVRVPILVYIVLFDSPLVFHINGPLLHFYLVLVLFREFTRPKLLLGICGHLLTLKMMTFALVRIGMLKQ